MAHYGTNKLLYDALTKAERGTVVELCKNFPDGPLHVVSTRNDTVLHLAAYSMQDELVLDLLKQLVTPDHFKKMTRKNRVGNTILHEAAAFNKLVQAAKIMLQKAPELMYLHNNLGETALYRAVRFGKKFMFSFLDGEVNKKYKSSEEIRKHFYQNRDKSSTILHTAITAERFDLAIIIAAKYNDLVVERDKYGRTALQLLANDSVAFQSRHRRHLRRFIYRLVPSRYTPNTEEVESSRWKLPWWEAIKEEKRQYEFALSLADYLILKDTSWKETDPMDDTHLGSKLTMWMKGKGNQSSPAKHIYETPLFTATKSGCIDIVEKILKMYPQSVEHLDRDDRNILHIAIKYRQMEIFDMVKKMDFPMRRLVRKRDTSSNSILHMAAEEGEIFFLKGKSQNPALQLQENLLLFERVKKITPQSFFRQVNSNGQTAEELFAQNNKSLREEAKEWLKGTAQNCSIVGVLIATVAFAAAYTVPGGSNQETGAPILLNQTFFIIFTITDVLSLTCTLTSVIVFLSILTSPFQLKDFKQSLPQQLMLGVTFLIFSVSMMMLAFAATIILMVRNRQQWTKIALYTVAFLPVSVFAISHMPLYFSLMKTFKYSLKKIGAIFPQYARTSVIDEDSNSSQPTEIPSSSSNSRPPNSNVCSINCCQCFREMLEKIKVAISRSNGGSFRSWIKSSFNFGKSQITSSPNTSQFQDIDLNPPRESQVTRLPV